MYKHYTPFVYWAQTKAQISLQIDLCNVKDVEIGFKDSQLRFKAEGQGARGLNHYEFELDLYLAIDGERSSYTISDRHINVVLKKQSSAWWPRLTCQPQKPQWLKIDFDKWKTDEVDDKDDGMYENQHGYTDDDLRNVCQDYPNLYDRLQKEEFGYRKEDIKKVYLIFYNLFQFVTFLYIMTVMGIRYYRDGPDTMNDIYEVVGNPMKFAQILQFLEVMHPLFGYTRGGCVVPFLQVGGRAFILFCMIEAEPRIQTKPVVFYVFAVWSMIEVIRYPYYITQLINNEIPWLTWLRHTIWIPLYPLGFLCESIIVLRNIPYFEETNRFTVSLPNAWNFTLHFPTFLRIYLLLLCIPGAYTMMTHMKRARQRKLNTTNIRHAKMKKS